MSARRKSLRLPLDFDPGYARLRVLEHLSEEQRLQIRRLERVLAAKTGKPCDVGETIATLAAAALFVFGLDPIAREDFDKVSSVVFDGDGDDSEIINVVINENAGEKWTLKQRRHEHETALKGRAA